MFNLTTQQLASIQEFLALEENKNNYPDHGTIGGELTYQFTPTGIGTVITIIYCKGTKMEAKLDLTDYDLW